MKSASAGSTRKGDALVTISPFDPEDRDRESIVEIHSPVAVLFSAAQHKAVRRGLDGSGSLGLAVKVDDNQAVDFVIIARVKAALERLNREEE